jgi:hypothetical protein
MEAKRLQKGKKYDIFAIESEEKIEPLNLLRH